MKREKEALQKVLTSLMSVDVLRLSVVDSKPLFIFGFLDMPVKSVYSTQDFKLHSSTSSHNRGLVFCICPVILYMKRVRQYSMQPVLLLELQVFVYMGGKLWAAALHAGLGPCSFEVFFCSSLGLSFSLLSSGFVS